MPARKHRPLTFPVLIEQDEDGMYVATVPSLRGCHTQARTLPALDTRVREAIDLCLKVQQDVAQLTFVGVHQVRVSR